MAACSASSTGTTANATTPASSPAVAVSSSAPGGAAPGDPNASGAPGAPGNAPGGASTAQYTPTGVYTLSTGSESKAGVAYTAAEADQSAVLVSGTGSVTLTDATITTSGASQSSDESSFYGLDAGVLAQSGGKVTLTGGTVTTKGNGANGVFAYGSGASVTVANATIKATGQYAHGAMASGGGAVSVTDTVISTAGANSGAIATDRGGGTITVSGGSVTTSGQGSPAIYSTGAITATGGTYSATGSESAVIEGANSITLTDATLTSSKADKWGVLIYQSMSGDASGTKGTFTMTGGSLANTAATGPLFYVTNSTGVITLKDVDVTAAGGVLVKAATGSWGNSGSNGGTVVLTADGETLAGDLVSDSSSSISATLRNGTTMTGSINSAALTLDATSVWNVTGDSQLTSLSDASGISGTTIANINGNGHTVTYDASLSANSALGARTYSLAGGGQLTPKS
ncbi:MAG: hypothetical protein ABSD62_10905 [Candidatus Limnocylindrales bacterium]